MGEWSRIAREADGTVGARVDQQGRPTQGVAERSHFYNCPGCGQPVDRRDLGAVFHHEDPDHRPLAPAVMARLVEDPVLKRELLEAWSEPGHRQAAAPGTP